eukprot:1151260-Pelagomonas_calceolata.AAC.4
MGCWFTSTASEGLCVHARCACRVYSCLSGLNFLPRARLVLVSAWSVLCLCPTLTQTAAALDFLLCLQGNMDPGILFGSQATIEARVMDVIKKARSKGEVCSKAVRYVLVLLADRCSEPWSMHCTWGGWIIMLQQLHVACYLSVAKPMA